MDRYIVCRWRSSNIPKRHPHTSRIAKGYFDVPSSNFLPSSLQHCRQLLVIEELTLKRDRSSQDEHSKSDLMKPRALHSSGLKDSPEHKCNICKKDGFQTKISSFRINISKLNLPLKEFLYSSFLYCNLSFFSSHFGRFWPWFLTSKLAQAKQRHENNTIFHRFQMMLLIVDICV